MNNKKFTGEDLLFSIKEGIDIDLKQRKVKFNPNHQENVDTNDLRNPKILKYSYTASKDPEIKYPLYSIFKRKDAVNNGDGNPLIYALKRENGWQFNTNSDFYAIFRRFVYAAHLIDKKYDVVVAVPSSNQFNNSIWTVICRILNVKYDNVFRDWLLKVSKSDATMNCIDWDSIEQEKLIPSSKFENLWQKWMNKSPEIDYFRYHDIPVKYRHYVKNVYYFPESDTIDYASMFNDKRVLILDDTFTSGQSLSEVTKTITKTYVPKNIDILTVFSPLDKDNDSITIIDNEIDLLIRRGVIDLSKYSK